MSLYDGIQYTLFEDNLIIDYAEKSILAEQRLIACMGHTMWNLDMANLETVCWKNMTLKLFSSPLKTLDYTLPLTC